VQVVNVINLMGFNYSSIVAQQGMSRFLAVVLVFVLI